MKRRIFAILIAVILLVVSAASVYAIRLPEAEKNIVYCSCVEIPLTLDLYSPDSSSKPAPLIIYVHGGGWYSGDKTTGTGQTDIPALIAAGYAVASIDYRLAPRYKFPAQIEDVKCAVRFLRANAGKYNLDSEKFGIFGDSAGGHLALLCGVTNEPCGFDALCCNVEQSSSVEAVVDLFGPADLTLEFQRDRSLLIEHVFGTDDPESDIIKAASPVNYVSSDDPPCLIIHGDQDTEVWPEQSQIMYQTLISSGVPSALVMIKNSGHGFVPVNGNITPNRGEITTQIVSFFDNYLK